MKPNAGSLVALALPLAFLTGCPGDDSTDDGSQNDGTTTDMPGTTDDGPGTTDDGPGTTDDGPGTTDDGPDPDSSSGEPADESRVRVMHLGVGAPGVDVFANGEGPVVTNLEFRQSTEYLAVPSDTYTFDVTVSGDPVENAVLSPELTLDPDTAYTAVAIGDLNMTDGAPGLQAIALVDDANDIDPANVRLTVVHAAPAVGEVDIWELAGPTELLSDVPFAGFATLPDIPAGPIDVGIDVDNDAVPDLTFSVDTTPLAGGHANVYANNDDTGVVLVVQLADGTVLEVPPN